jgi:hypothetical protein
LWYGIVRIIMTPLRMNNDGNSFGEYANMITTICWIVIGLTFLILNHFVFSKYLRKYMIPWYFFAFINLFKSKNNKQNLEKYIYNPTTFLWYNYL